MTLRRLIIGGGVVGVAAAIGIGWWLLSPLFIDTVVDEAFPFELPAAAAMDDMTEDEKQQLHADLEAAMPTESELADLSESDRDAVQEKVMTAAAAMPDKMMDEPAPGADPTAAPAATPAATPAAPAGPEELKVANFGGADEFHLGSGTATIFRTPDGGLLLRLADFSVTNGPALSVLLSPSFSPQSSQELGDYIDIGALKGNIGNQNYEIPDGTDVDSINSIVIYCVPFHVVFATATFPA